MSMDPGSIIISPVASIPVFDRLKSFLAGRKILALALFLYLPFVFLGYGSDVDTFRVLDAGRNFVSTGDYVPSRRPGYLVFEMSVFALDQIGGSVLSNLGTLYWALVLIDNFQRICQRNNIPNSNLLMLLLIVQPVFWYNATTTSDYIWALGMLMAGFDRLERGKFGWAGLAFGLASGCRISSVIVAIAMIGYTWLRFPQKHRYVAVTALLTAAIGGLAYVLPWDFSEWRISFWDVSMGTVELWTPFMQFGRFFYKNIYLWGFPTSLFLAFLLVLVFRDFNKWKHLTTKWIIVLSFAVLAGLQLLFFRYPIEIEYLIPTLPFWLFIIGSAVKPVKLLRIFVILVFLFGFVNLNIAKPDQPGQASSAFIGLWLEPGYLVQKTRMRVSLMGCDSRSCYNEQITQRPEIDSSEK